MGAPEFNGPFVMPQVREFIPRRLQPWLYVLLAFTFQLSGGMYLAALNEIIGGRALMREDITMALYSSLAGMAMYFPLLFRMKFRFTNKTLLIGSCVGIIICNFISMRTSNLPLLWAVCFVSGCCKIQGTFECMSNIQLWMTPKRDFRVFFPLLHIVVLCSIQGSDIIMTYIAYHYEWPLMHYFTIALMLVDLIFLITCVRHFRFMRKLPLFGIDWTGAALWSALLLQVTYLFNYGDWYDWWNSSVIVELTGFIFVTFAGCLWRMFTIRHPYLEPKMWTYKYLVPILLLITVLEALLGTEYILEEIFYEDIMHYAPITDWAANGYTIVGVLVGCLFTLWWLKVLQRSSVQLIMIGIMGIIGYVVSFYFIISPDINIEKIFLPCACRGFAVAVLGATFMNCLHEIMSFQHFFQSLCIFNMLHMVMGGVFGCAIYGMGLRYYMSENFSRYGSQIDAVQFGQTPFDFEQFMELFIRDIEMISIKQIYGWVAFASIAVLIGFLLYDAPARRGFKPMPSWKSVGTQMMNTFRRSKS